jgi:DNA-binding transcriptional LysR family regulator
MGSMISMHVDLRMILHATTLASERSFAKAAKLLHLSQPALSRSILELEKRVGDKLFDRNNGSVVPTEAGRLFLRHGEDILEKAALMEREIRQVSGREGGELAIGAGTYPTDMFLGQAIGTLTQKNRGIRVRIVNDQARDLIQLLRKRELDVLVGDAAWLEGTDDIHAIPLNAHQGYVVVRAGHPLVGKKSITLESLTAHPLVTSGRAASRLATLASSASGEASNPDHLARWLPAVATESLSMMCATVASSDAFTFLPLQLALSQVDAGKLSILPIELPWLKVTFSVMHLAHRPFSPLGIGFQNAVKEADSALLAEETASAARLRKVWKRR